MDMASPSPECLATNEPYLKSLAWCLYSHCDGAVELSALEHWWHLNVPGKQVHQPVPNMSYQQALAKVKTPPTEVLGEDDMLNRTVQVAEEDYIKNYNQNMIFEEIETASERYG